MWKKAATVAGALVLLGVGLVSLMAFSGGGWCHHGRREPAQAAAFVTNRVEDALDDLDATPDQRTKILAVKDRMLDAAKAIHAEQGVTHAALLEAWRSETPDAAKLHALVEQRADEMRKLAHEAVDAGIEVHGILTPDQRARLTRKIERWHR